MIRGIIVRAVNTSMSAATGLMEVTFECTLLRPHASNFKISDIENEMMMVKQPKMGGVMVIMEPEPSGGWTLQMAGTEGDPDTMFISGDETEALEAVQDFIEKRGNP